MRACDWTCGARGPLVQSAVVQTGQGPLVQSAVVRTGQGPPGAISCGPDGPGAPWCNQLWSRWARGPLVQSAVVRTGQEKGRDPTADREPLAAPLRTGGGGWREGRHRRCFLDRTHLPRHRSLEGCRLWGCKEWDATERPGTARHRHSSLLVQSLLEFRLLQELNLLTPQVLPSL